VETGILFGRVNAHLPSSDTTMLRRHLRFRGFTTSEASFKEKY
jgi:hypothetical protein